MPRDRSTRPQPGQAQAPQRWLGLGRGLGHDTRASVGIGTMIVFIATILVAATATAVMIDTAGQLEAKSRLTGEQSTQAIANSLVVKGVYGSRDTVNDAALNDLNITIALSAGADKIDLAQAVIRISDGTTVKELAYHASNAGDGYFVADAPRDNDNSFSGSNPAMTDGDLVNLKINLDHQGLDLVKRTNVEVSVIPEQGIQLRAGFVTPASYGVSTVIILR